MQEIPPAPGRLPGVLLAGKPFPIAISDSGARNELTISCQVDESIGIVDRDAVVVGKTGRPFDLPIERGKLREFIRAVGETSINPDEPEAVIPPTFLVTTMWWEHDDSNPLHAANLDMKRMLHVEQEFVFHGRPPAVGVVLTGQSRISKVWEKHGKRSGDMTFVSVTTEFRNQAGDVVAEGTWTEAHISQAAAT